MNAPSRLGELADRLALPLIAAPMFRVSGVDLVVAACRLAGRNLTPTEWQTYLGRPDEYRATCPEFG